MRTFILTSAAALAGLALLLRRAAPDAWDLPFAARLALVVLLALAFVHILRSNARAAVRRYAALCFGALTAAAALLVVPVRIEPGVLARRPRGRSCACGCKEFAPPWANWRPPPAAWRRKRAPCFPTPRRAPIWRPSSARPSSMRWPVRWPRHAARLDSDSTPQACRSSIRKGSWWRGPARPWPVQSGTRLTQLAGGVQPVYFRRSGVRTLLSVELRDAPSSRAPAGAVAAEDSAQTGRSKSGPLRVLVDLPVEVHYRIHNRFLQSRGLADQLSGSGLEVSFQYDAPAIPPYLTQKDLEIGGDEQRGTYVLGLLRDAAGKALVLCRVSGLPYRDTLDAAMERREMGVRWLLVIALAIRLDGVAWGVPGRAQRTLAAPRGVTALAPGRGVECALRARSPGPARRWWPAAEPGDLCHGGFRRRAALAPRPRAHCSGLRDHRRRAVRARGAACLSGAAPHAAGPRGWCGGGDRRGLARQSLRGPRRGRLEPGAAGLCNWISSRPRWPRCMPRC